jgi:hypothetical protein
VLGGGSASGTKRRWLLLLSGMKEPSLPLPPHPPLLRAADEAGSRGGGDQ